MPKLCSLYPSASRHSFFESGKSGENAAPKLPPGVAKNSVQEIGVVVLAVGK
jgi:hypothetical protein